MPLLFILIIFLLLDEQSFHVHDVVRMFVPHEAPIVDWFMVLIRIKKTTYLKDIGLHPQTSITALHAIVNTVERTYVFRSMISKHAHPTTITKPKKSLILNPIFCWCFIVDQQMQHTHCGVNLIGKNWRLWKNNTKTFTYLLQWT